MSISIQIKVLSKIVIWLEGVGEVKPLEKVALCEGGDYRLGRPGDSSVTESSDP